MSNSRVIIRKRAVEHKTGYSYSTINRLEKAKQFPERVQLSERAIGWFEDEVDDWVRNRVRGRGRSLPEQHAGTGLISVEEGAQLAADSAPPDSK
jgi:prophage regulatory protein